MDVDQDVLVDAEMDVLVDAKQIVRDVEILVVEHVQMAAKKVARINVQPPVILVVWDVLIHVIQVVSSNVVPHAILLVVLDAIVVAVGHVKQDVIQLVQVHVRISVMVAHHLALQTAH